jgi:hypothetical protein
MFSTGNDVFLNRGRRRGGRRGQVYKRREEGSGLHT